jgi:hypothetical protein
MSEEDRRYHHDPHEGETTSPKMDDDGSLAETDPHEALNTPLPDSPPAKSEDR